MVILHEDRYTFLIITRSFLLRMRNISAIRSRENGNTFYVQRLFLENRVVYNILWTNIIQPDRPREKRDFTLMFV